MKGLSTSQVIGYVHHVTKSEEITQTIVTGDRHAKVGKHHEKSITGLHRHSMGETNEYGTRLTDFCWTSLTQA